MLPILRIITEEHIEDLASRSHLRYGKEIVKSGEINFIKENTFNLIATVKFRKSDPKTVELMSTPKGFRFKCSCSNKKDNFCEHCVAASLAAIQRKDEE
jgi:uncharacterized Zn finger protein